MEKKMAIVKVLQVVQSKKKKKFRILQKMILGIEQYVNLTNETREQLV